MIKVTQVRSFLWNALETRMCVHRCSLHQRASAASAKRVNTMQKKTTGCRNSFCGVKQTFYIAWSRQLYPSMHHCRSLVRLCAMAVSIDIRYKPLLACAHECKPNLVVLWPMGQSKKQASLLVTPFQMTSNSVTLTATFVYVPTEVK